ncbi:MAG: PepSY domain-containing protein [Gammaproteobacteria bacterium]|nr:PepSY domain-containing protein [Gammaproteobacteria bacterium]
MAKRVKRALVTIHLYLGLLLSIVFAIWFVSGIAMIYYRTPVLDVTQRIAFEPSFAPQLEFMKPSEVSGLALDWPDVEDLHASTFQGRPLYRWRQGNGRWSSGWADDGSAAFFHPERLAAEAARWFGADAAFKYSGSFDENSQWTFFRSESGHLPLYRFSTGLGPLRSEVYFSSRTGEPLIATTPTSRLLYILGPGLHYASFYPIRNRNQFWRDLVNWTSGLGVVLALTGVAIGVWRIRWGAVGTSRRKIPFTRFWMHWHHLLGLLVAIPTFTFVLSGLFSMNPGGMFPSMAVSDEFVVAKQGPRGSLVALPEAHAGLASLPFNAVRVDYLQRDGGTVLLAHSKGGNRQRIDFSRGSWRAEAPHSEAALIEAFERVHPGRLKQAQWLEHYDNHYYSRKERYRPLPVLRLILDEPQATWLYVEPTTGAFLRQTDRGSRARRWLYNGLHSLDPQFLLTRPWLWTAVIWSLSLGGLAMSVTGVALTVKWLRRKLGTRRSRGEEGADLAGGVR